MADPLDILYGRPSRGSENDIAPTLANIASVIASIPERRRQAAERRAQLDAESLNAQTRAGNLQLQQQEAQQKQAMQQKAAQLDQAVNQIVSQAFITAPDGTKRLDRNRLQQGFAKGGVPLDVQAKAFKSVDDLEESGAKFNQERNEHKARVINAVLESPDVTQGALLAISDGVANGWLSDDDKQSVYALLASGQDPTPALKQMRDSLSDKYRPKRELKDVGPGHKIVDETGATVAENPLSEKPEKTPTVGSFEDYVTAKFGTRPTPDQITQARKEYNQADDRPRVNVSMSPDKLVKVEHKDPATGKTVIEWVPQGQLRGQKFEKGNSATLEGRIASSEAVNQTGNDIIAQLSDPKIAAQVGPAMGRFNTLRDFIGNPPPELAELAGAIESYSLANMGVHGMRSVQGAEQVKKLLDTKHTPESLIKTIQGLNKFSQHFMENQGRTAPASKPHAGESLTVSQIKAVAEKRKQSYAEAKADAEALGYVVK